MPRKMKTLHSVAASPIDDVETPDRPLTVVFDLTTPPFAEIDQQRAFFRHHATVLVDALASTLPQGMLDQVLAELCERKASTLRVRG